MVLIKGDRKGGVCRKNEFGVTLSPVPVWVGDSNEERTIILSKKSHFMQAMLTGADTVAW